jgi:hypothetical protein
MTIELTAPNHPIEIPHESSSKASVGTLYDLKHHSHRVQRFKELYEKYSGVDFKEEDLSKIGNLSLSFFRSLDDQHDDALKFRSANIWKKEKPTICIFSTPHMLVSDEQFIKINSLYINFQPLYNADRLDFIEKTRPKLIHDGTTVETKNYMESGLFDFTLKELRQIKSPEVITKLWADLELKLNLFSIKQMKAVIKSVIFIDILENNSRTSLQKYLPKFGEELFNEIIP